MGSKMCLCRIDEVFEQVPTHDDESALPDLRSALAVGCVSANTCSKLLSFCVLRTNRCSGAVCGSIWQASKKQKQNKHEATYTWQEGPPQQQLNLFYKIVSAMASSVLSSVDIHVTHLRKTI